MSSWESKELGDVITLKRGYDLPTKDRVEGQVPIVSSSGITGSHNEAKVKAPGVVTGRYGTLGEVFYLSEDFWPLNTSLYVKDFKENDERFISYFLRTLPFEDQNVAGAVPGVNRNYLHKLEVDVPDLTTQKRIASQLSTFDDLIENNSRRTEILEEMARRIYREWFVHFRYPGHEDDALVDFGTDLGEIPKGWKVKELGDLYKVKSGFAFRSKNLSDEGPYGIIKIKNVNDNEVDIDNVEYHHKDIPERAEKYKLSYDDMLITMTGYVGRIARMPKTSTTYYVNQRVGKFIPKVEDKDYKNYICGVLKSEKYQDKMENLAYGAAQPNLSATNAHGLEIAIPPDDIVEEYGKVIQPLYDMQHQLRAKNRKLKETRDLLLPKLVSGKVDVEELNMN